MTAELRFAFGYPEASGTGADLLDAGPVAEVAAAAERTGWSGFAFTEHPAPGARWMAAGGHQALDPFVALGHAAAVTTLAAADHVPGRRAVPLPGAAGQGRRDGRRALGRAPHARARGRLPQVGVPRPRGRLRRAQRAVRRGPRRAAPALERRAVLLRGAPLRRPRHRRPAPPCAAADPRVDRRELAPVAPPRRRAGRRVDAAGRRAGGRPHHPHAGGVDRRRPGGEGRRAARAGGGAGQGPRRGRALYRPHARRPAHRGGAPPRRARAAWRRRGRPGCW